MNKLMDKKRIGAVLGVAFCAAGCTQGQTYLPPSRLMSLSAVPSPLVPLRPSFRRNALRHPAPMTPELKARIEEMGRLDRAAMVALQAGQYAEAEADARQSVSVGGGSGLGQELLVASLNAQGKTEEALQAYKVIADKGDVEPRNEVPYALLLLKSGQWAQAATVYNKTLPNLVDKDDPLWVSNRFSPDVPQPRELETVLHAARGLTYLGGAWDAHPEHEEAMREFEKASQMQPDSVVTNYYYGYGWQNLGFKSPLKAANAERAKAAFQKAASSGDDDIKKTAAEGLRRIDIFEEAAKVSKQPAG